jgi:hypothetical protein
MATIPGEGLSQILNFALEMLELRCMPVVR